MEHAQHGVLAGFFRVLLVIQVPRTRAEHQGFIPAQQRLAMEWYRGTADALYQNLDIIRRHAPENVIVQNNVAAENFFIPGDFSSGGGIQASGNVTILDSAIINNTATFSAGGIDFNVFGGTPKTLSITNSTISGNTAGDAAVDRGVLEVLLAGLAGAGNQRQPGDRARPVDHGRRDDVAGGVIDGEDLPARKVAHAAQLSIEHRQPVDLETIVPERL